MVSPLGVARIAFAGLRAFEVVSFAVNKHDDVGVLFDRDRIHAKVGELRALVLALLDGARQLRQGDDRDRQFLGQRLREFGNLRRLPARGRRVLAGRRRR